MHEKFLGILLDCKLFILHSRGLVGSVFCSGSHTDLLDFSNIRLFHAFEARLHFVKFQLWKLVPFFCLMLRLPLDLFLGHS